MVTTQNFTQINNDVNGNPRYVIHFLALIPKNIDNVLNLSIDGKYNFALSIAKKIGGKKYHNKSFGGGIVFQSYSTQNLCDKINQS